METTLQATIREPGKKGTARSIRREGLMPAVMYGPDNDPVSITVSPDALERIFTKTGDRNTVIQIEVDGKTHPTLVKQVQRHPVKRNLVHVDFYRLSKKRKVEVMVPVVGVGRPAGAILGGRLRLIRRTVRARCDFDKIPANFSVDITPMNIGDMVKASEIPTPDGVELVYDNDFNVLTVYGKRVKAAKPEAEAAES